MPKTIISKRTSAVFSFCLNTALTVILISIISRADTLPSRQEIHKAINYSDSLMSIQKLDSAIVVADDALAGAQKAFGESDTTTARVLHRLGVYHYLLAEYDDAEDCWRRALKTREAILGEKHPDVALLLNNLGGLYWNKGEYAESESTYARAIEIWGETLGPDHPDQALSIDGLATLYWSLGRYAEAESLFYRALDIREKAYGPFHEDVATTLNNLAILYDDQGKYDKTEEMYLRALDIMEKVLGENHPNVAVTLNNLANLYFFRGMYSKVEKYHQRALQIRLNAFGEDHPEVAYSLNNLAVLYWGQGRLKEAEEFYRRALKIWEKIDSEHPDAARSMSNLADILREKGQYESADSLMRKALKIREKALGADHPEVALSLDNLINLNMNLGNYEQALALHDRAIAIREQVFGNDHPALAWNLNGKGKIFMLLGDYSRALPLLRQALAIRDKFLSPEHPDVIDNQLDLARLFACLGDVDSSAYYFEKALDSRRYFIENVFSYASEEQKLRYINTYPLLDYSVLSAALKYKTPALTNTAFKMVLSGKAAVIDAVAEEKKTAYCADDQHLKKLLDSRSEAVEEIANLSIAGMTFRDEETYHSQLMSLYSIKDSLETELSSACFEIRDSFVSKAFEIEDIAKSLPANTLILEYVKFEPYDFENTGTKKNQDDDYRYILFALKPDGRIFLQELGAADTIDSLVQAAREMIYEAGSDIYATGDEILVEKLNRITTELRNLIFEPIAGYVETGDQILICPDGRLNLIPFEILPDDDGCYLVEKYDISYLSSGRDLLKFKPGKIHLGNIVLIADPDFAHSQPAESPVSIRGDSGDLSGYFTYHPERGQSDCLEAKFDRLSYTKAETQSIAELFKKSGITNITELYGQDASEQNLKALAAPPGVLHISTHGYFCSRESDSLANPLLKSGLVLAGANLTITGHDSAVGDEDGILTALEVSGLDLENAELATLSACETGIGDIKISEGVYGLRRAFQHAGAKSILMSLWRVPDKETSELMTHFYQNWLAGNNKSEALRAAMLSLLDSRRQKYGRAHPYFWGAFVILGDPQ